MGNRAVITLDPQAVYSEKLSSIEKQIDHIKEMMIEWGRSTLTEVGKQRVAEQQERLEDLQKMQTELKDRKPSIDNQIGIYLHWNGGMDSVRPFLMYCQIQGYRTPDSDCYGWARLAQTITNSMPGGLSVGIDTCNHLDIDNYDNGVYLIKGWEVVGRMYHKGAEQEEYNALEFLIELDKDQPQSIQLGAEKITEEYNKITGGK